MQFIVKYFHEIRMAFFIFYNNVENTRYIRTLKENESWRGVDLKILNDSKKPVGSHHKQKSLLHSNYSQVKVVEIWKFGLRP